ncbi:MAG: hypothetical protein HC893_10870 [Chloroflexaceae bacterium]|nr:hypothetical protein [Chloroflexaceae bacterium]
MTTTFNNDAGSLRLLLSTFGNYYPTYSAPTPNALNDLTYNFTEQQNVQIAFGGNVSPQLPNGITLGDDEWLTTSNTSVTISDGPPTCVPIPC